mgnify:CR=1 FL=1
MRNPLIEMAVDMLNAVQALRLKTHRLASVAEGVEIEQPGKPRILITHQAAKDFAEMQNDL